MFTVHESSTDSQEIFFDHLSVNVRNATVQTSHVTHDNETFEVKIYPNGTGTMMYDGYVSGSIEMLTSRQQVLNLIATFYIKAYNKSWSEPRVRHFLGLKVNAKKTFYLKLVDTTMNQSNELINSGGIFTITMRGSYFICRQHTIASSQAKFNPKIHNAVNTTYTWTMCDLGLNFNDEMIMMSYDVFVGFGVAEFFISIHLESEFVSIYSELITPSNIKLPLRVRYTFALLYNSSPEYAVIDKFSISAKYDFKHKRLGTKEHFDTRIFEKFMEQKCATLKYNVAYKLQ